MPSKLRVGDDAKIFTVKDFNAVNEFHAPWKTWSWIDLSHHVSTNSFAMLLCWPLVTIVTSYLKCQHLVYMSWQRGSSLFGVPGLSVYTIERVERLREICADQFDNWSYLIMGVPCYSNARSHHYLHPFVMQLLPCLFTSQSHRLMTGYFGHWPVPFQAAFPRTATELWEQKRAELDEDPQQQYECTSLLVWQ